MVVSAPCPLCTMVESGSESSCSAGDLVEQLLSSRAGGREVTGAVLGVVRMTNVWPPPPDVVEVRLLICWPGEGQSTVLTSL